MIELEDESLQQHTSADALKALVRGELVSSGVLGIEDLERIRRGQLDEVLSLVDADPVRSGAQELQLSTIDSYSSFQAVVRRVVDRALGLPPEEAFLLVQSLRERSKSARQLVSIANTYLAIGASVRSTGLTDIVEASNTNDFGQRVYDNRFDNSVTLPDAYSLTSSRDETESRFDAAMDRLAHLEDAQATAATAVGYKEALIMEVLVNQVVDATKDHIGVDITNRTPVVSIHDVDTFAEAEKYSRPLPEQLDTWRQKGLQSAHVPDIAHLDFYDNPDRIREVVDVVLPRGSEDDSFQAYLEAWERCDSERSSGNHRALQRALYELKCNLYSHLRQVFAECHENVHPLIEVQARNMAFYGLSDGEGTKTASDVWQHIQTLKDNGHLDFKNSPTLSSSLDALQDIAYREGIYLEPVFRELDARLESDLADGMDASEIANVIERAYDEKRAGRAPHAPDLPGNMNWYVTTVLFRTADTRDRLTFDDGGERSYGAVMRLVDHIRNFGEE